MIKKLLYVFLLCFGSAFAQTYPSKPVTIITSFPVGAGPDVLLRSIGDLLSKKWNQPVVIENRPGGKGYVAVNAFRQVKPDGYTLLQLDDTHLNQRDPYPILDQLDPVATLLRSSFFVTVAADSQYKTLGELLADTKTKNINYGSWGVGTLGHIGGETISTRANVSMTHVPYKEMSQLFSDISNKQPAWGFGSPASTRPLYKAGKLKYLAVSSTKRLPNFPDVPTVAESGFPGFELYGYVSIFVPKGAPEEVQRKLNADINDIINNPSLRRVYSELFYESLTYDLKRARAHAVEESKK